MVRKGVLVKSARSLLDPYDRSNDPDAVVHRRTRAAKDEITSPWPAWLNTELIGIFQGLGIQQPWLHQTQAADLIHEGHHTIVSTGTASGKSMAYLMPGLDLLYRAKDSGFNDADAGASILYICPTKALAADQLSAVQALEVPGVRAAAYDGDTDQATRAWVRQHGNFIFTNPEYACIAASCRTTLPGPSSSNACVTW